MQKFDSDHNQDGSDKDHDILDDAVDGQIEESKEPPTPPPQNLAQASSKPMDLLKPEAAKSEVSEGSPDSLQVMPPKTNSNPGNKKRSHSSQRINS